MKTIDIMIDLETLGTKTSAPVISIGACVFSIEHGNILSTFYRAISLEDQLHSRFLDAPTIKWWMEQADAAKTIFKEDAVTPRDALRAFSAWFADLGCPDAYVWGNGSTFDISIMEDFYDCFSDKVPWKFSSIMDLRTFKRFCGGAHVIENVGTKHNALDDAIAQAKFVLKCLGGK